MKAFNNINALIHVKAENKLMALNKMKAYIMVKAPNK